MDRRPSVHDWFGLKTLLLWSYVLLFAFAVGCLSLIFALLGGVFWDPDRRFFARMSWLWGWGLSKTVPITVDVRGHRATGGPYIITPNHCSVIDLLVTYRIPLRYRTVVKRSWFYGPFGLNIWLSGYIPTQKTGDPASARKLFDGCKHWLDRGVSLLTFPEGTRSREWRVKRFKRGAFELAMQTGTPILPVALAGTNDASHPSSLRFSLPQHVIVEIMAPVDPADYEDSRQLRDAVRRRVTDRVAELRDELWETRGQGPTGGPRGGV